MLSNPALSASFIDLKDQFHWERSALVLDLIDNAHWEAVFETPDPDFPGDAKHVELALHQVEDVVRHILSSGDGSWLLRARAKALVNKIKKDPYAHSRISNATPLPSQESIKASTDTRDSFFLMREDTLETIKKEFGIELAHIAPNEQYWFLQLLKTRTEEELEPVKKFVETYGLPGLRTFLALDYGKELGDKIVEIGARLPEAEVREIFTKYAEVLDHSAGFTAKIKAGLESSDLPDKEKSELPNAIGEAIARRSKDLLLSAHVVGIEGGTDFEIKDILTALEGLNTLLKLAGSIGNSEHARTVYTQVSASGLTSFRMRDVNDKEYILRIFIRPEENTLGQARINFELDFDTPLPNTELRNAFTQKTRYLKSTQNKPGYKESSVLRVGIDLDTHDKAHPAVSLDLGRNSWRSGKLERTGDVLGNLLTLSGSHHNTESFLPEMADKETFKQVALALARHLGEQAAHPVLAKSA